MVAVVKEAPARIVRLDVSMLETCERVRVRKNKPNENSDIVGEYAEAYECGLITDPLCVFREHGTERYIVADGEHRLLALRRAKIKQVDVVLHEGDEVAALDFAIGCNQAHGLRRSKADKYHAFARIMETPSLKDQYRTDTELSEKIGVAKRTIASYKVEWRNSETPGASNTARRAKKAAQDGAEKKTRKDLKSRKDDATCIITPPLKNKEKVEKPLPKPLTPEQKKVAAQVRESTTKTEKPSTPKTDVPAAALHDLKRAIATLASTKIDPAAVAGKIDAANVKLAADWLWKLMEVNS